MRWHTDSTFGELWRPSSGSTLCTPSLLQRPELPIGVWGCGENMTRADGHATILVLMYDTYNLLFLFVKNGVPQFFLCATHDKETVPHGHGLCSLYPCQPRQRPRVSLPSSTASPPSFLSASGTVSSGHHLMIPRGRTACPQASGSEGCSAFWRLGYTLSWP